MADILVVQSKVKEYVKKKGNNCAGDVAEVLTKKVKTLLDDASKRAKANGRKTVKGTDV